MTKLFEFQFFMSRIKKHGLLLLPFLVIGMLTSCIGKQEIVSDISENEANEIIVFLAGHGIPADKVASTATGGAGGAEVTMWNIQVPSGQSVDALSILSRNGLPRRPSSNLLQLFAKTGLVSSAQEEQIRFQEGLSAQIAGVIRKIDGVIDANVQISFPATESPQGMMSEEPQGEVRASVYVKHSGILDDPNSQLVSKIKRLVAGSVVGLSFDNVTVVTDRARFTEASLPTTPEGIAQKEWESVWSIVMTKDSIGRFRTIFTILFIIIFLLAAALGWFIWKLFPIVAQGGGIPALFNTFRPLIIQGDSVQPKNPPPKPEE